MPKRAVPHLRRQVEPRQGAPDQPPIRGVLQLHPARRRGRGEARQLSVRHRTPGGMGHCAGNHGEFVGRQLPLQGRRPHQAGTSGGGGLADHVPCVHHAARRAGRVDADFAPQLAHDPSRGLDPPQALRGFFFRTERQRPQQHCDIAVDGVGARLPDLHRIQRHVQFLRRQHRQGGVDTLPHFAAGHGEDHAAAWQDLDPAVEGYAPITHRDQARGPNAGSLRRHAPSHQQRTCGRRASEQPGAPFHAFAPAARLIASRTR